MTRRFNDDAAESEPGAAKAPAAGRPRWSGFVWPLVVVAIVAALVSEVVINHFSE